MARIKDIAKLTGYSSATVSSILSGGRASVRFSERARNKVMRAAAKTEYTPKAVHGIGYLYSMPNSPLTARGSNWGTPMLASIEDMAIRDGKTLSFFGYSYDDLDKHLKKGHLSQIIRRQLVDGLIVSDRIREDLLEQIAEMRLPYVLMNVGDGHAHSRDSVCFDELFTGMEITRYLLGLGHRRIAHLTVSWSVMHYSAPMRLQGYKIAMSEAGQPPEILTLVEEDYEILGTELREKLSRDDRPTALFVYTELMALFCYRLLNEMGLSFSEVSLISPSWNRTDELDMLGISYLQLPAREMGNAAYDMLIRKIETQTSSPTISMRGHIFSRASTQAADE